MEGKRNHPKFKINICNGNDRGGVFSTSEQLLGSLAVIFYFEEQRWNIKPTLNVPKQGRGWWFGLFPPFLFCYFSQYPNTDLSVTALFSLQAYTPTRPELPRLSYLTLITLLSILADHASMIQHYFWTQILWYKRFKTTPNGTGNQNISRQKQRSLTTEVKWTHFLNFLLYTMDAGKQDNKVPHNWAEQNTSLYSQTESDHQQNTLYKPVLRVKILNQRPLIRESCREIKHQPKEKVYQHENSAQ